MLKLQYFGHLMWTADPLEKNPDAGKDWRQKEKGAAKDEMVRRHHWLNRHEFEQTLGDSGGYRSLAYCSPWGGNESDTTQWLNNSNNSARAPWFLDILLKVVLTLVYSLPIYFSVASSKYLSEQQVSAECKYTNWTSWGATGEGVGGGLGTYMGWHTIKVSRTWEQLSIPGRTFWRGGSITSRIWKEPPAWTCVLQSGGTDICSEHVRTDLREKLLRSHSPPPVLLQGAPFAWAQQEVSGGTSGKEPACQCRRCKKHGFNLWVGKMLWRRAQQPTLVFLPGESYGQRHLVGYSP